MCVAQTCKRRRRQISKDKRYKRTDVATAMKRDAKRAVVAARMGKKK